jgi:hypothetical protein
MAQGTTKGVPIDIDPLLAADSDLLVPSQKAVKSYAQPQLNGTGFVKASGTTISYDNSTYLTGTGASGQVAFWNGTTTQTGSNNLFWDNVNSRLGIGTTTPGYPLEVTGIAPSVGSIAMFTATNSTEGLGIYNSASSNPQPSLRLFHNTSSYRIWLYGAGNLAFVNTWNGSTPLFNFFGSGNFGIGVGFTDAGYKLDVNGKQRVQYGTVERGAIFTHSNGTYAEIVLGNGSAAGVGVVEIHRNGTSAISLRSNAVLFNTSRLITPSTFFVNGPYGGSNIGTSVRLASNTVDQGAYTATSGTQNTVVIGNSGNEIWQPSSGTATYNLFSVLPSINTSGTYAGIVRGFYYSPTLTSITGVTHRAIETVTGDVIFGSTSGNVGIGTTTFLGKFQVGSGSATQFQVASSGASIYVGPSSGNYNMNITTNTIQSSNSGTTNTYLYIQPNGTGNVAMCSSGTNKVLIGTTTDAGYKLDVNGTLRVQGTLALNNGNTYISNTSNNIWIAAVNSTANDVVVIPGRQLNVNSTGTYTAQSSAIAQIDSTTKGFLPPRMTNAQRTAIATPAVGLIVYCTDATEGLYIYKSTGWTFII